MDLDEAERKASSMRRRLRMKGKKDQAQDSRLEALENENEQLRACFASLSHLLVSRSVLSEMDLRSLAENLDSSLEEDE